MSSSQEKLPPIENNDGYLAVAKGVAKSVRIITIINCPYLTCLGPELAQSCNVHVFTIEF